MDGLVDLLAHRNGEDLHLEATLGALEPCGDLAVERLEVAPHVEVVPGGRLEGDDLALARAVARNRDPATVHRHVAVADELAGLCPARAPSGPIDDVVEP